MSNQPRTFGRFTGGFVLGLCLVSRLVASADSGVSTSPGQHISAPHTRKQITIGDIIISNFSASRAVQGAGGFHITGSGTTATVPDAPRHATLILHADEIDGTPDGKDAAGYLELGGHITFTISQVLNGVARHVSGTAGHAKMRRSEGRIKLTEVVHANIADSSTLSEPAVIISQNAEIDLNTEPYRFIADGSDQISDIVFVPRRKSESSGVNRVHISRFSHGDFQPGVTAAFTGNQVRAEVISPALRDSAVLYSSSILAEYDHTVLTEIRSTVPVTYHAEQRLASGMIGQSADGSARSAELNVSEKVLLLSGATQSRLYNADHLVGPGTMVSKTARLDLSAAPYRYSADGPADITSLHFIVSPARNSKQGPTTVHIFGYLHMARTTEQTVEFSGPYTTLDLSRQTPKSASHVTCSKLTIRLMPGNKGIEQIAADDHVHYRLTTAIATSKDRTLDRTLTGTADSILMNLPPPTAGAASRESIEKMTLHNVICTLLSPDFLIGEATLRADAVDQITEAGQTRLTITGNPAMTDLVAPMRAGTAPTNGGTQTTATSVLHLYKFQRAQLNKDGSLFESGTHSILDIKQTPIKRTSHIQSDRIDVSVDPVSKSPVNISAQGGVIVTSEEPAEAKTGLAPAAPAQLRRLEASCDKAVYNITIQQIGLDGNVVGRITDRTLLAEPCDIRADNATIGLQSPYSTLNLHDAPRSGRQPASDVRLAVLLKPTASSVVKPSTQPKRPTVPAKPYMRFHLYRFRDAKLEIGVGASAEGLGTTLDAERSDGTTRMSLFADSISVHLGADGQTLESAEAINRLQGYNGSNIGSANDVVFNAQSIRDTGVQSVHGTAANVVYLGVLDQVRATGRVNVVLVDPQTLASPGSLHTDSVTVDIGSPEFVYNCSGDSGVNDIDFTMLEHGKTTSAAGTGSIIVAAPRVKATKPPTQLRVHAYSFENAVLQTGSAVTLTGPTSHLDMLRRDVEQPDAALKKKPEEKPIDSQIQSPHISATFSASGEELSSATAEDGVHFVFNMPTASGLSEQTYSGFAARLEYALENDAGSKYQAQNMAMTGHLSIKVLNPEELAEPGLIEGLDGRVLHLTVINGVTKYQWDAGDNPVTVLLRPKQRLPKAVRGSLDSNMPNSPGKAP